MSNTNKKIQVAILFVAACLGIALPAHAATDEAMAKRARSVIESIRAATRPVRDLSCTLQVRQSGNESREYLQNRIRMFEIGKQRGLYPDARADEEIAKLKKTLETLDGAEKVLEVSQWKMRSDGLFHTVNKLTNPDGTKRITELGYDGEELRWYDPAFNRGSVSHTVRKNTDTPEFGWAVESEPFANFLERALKSGSIEISDEPNVGNEKRLKIVAVTPTDRARGDQKVPVFVRIWLNASRNYVPIRIEEGHAIGPVGDWIVGKVTTDIVCKEIVAGVCYPISCRYEGVMIGNLADPDQPMEKWKLAAFPSTVVVKCELSDIKVNQGLKKEAFTIDFPAGTIMMKLKD
jgi:outer membrane lipoprotein-sorting protein